MNEYAILIGVMAALLTILIFNRGHPPNYQTLYAWYLATFPLYYWLFAVFSGYSIVLLKEILFGIPFIGLAWACAKLKRNNFYLLLAFGYILHTGYGFYHSSLFVNQGVPAWWPEYSGVINLIVGIYIAAFIVVRSSGQIAERKSPQPILNRKRNDGKFSADLFIPARYRAGSHLCSTQWNHHSSVDSFHS